MYRFALLLCLIFALLPTGGWASTFRAPIVGQEASLVPGTTVAGSAASLALGIDAMASPGELGNLVASLASSVDVAGSAASLSLEGDAMASPGELGSLMASRAHMAGDILLKAPLIAAESVGDFMLNGPLSTSATLLGDGAASVGAIGQAVASSGATSVGGDGLPVWAQVMLSTLPALATFFVFGMKLLGVFKDAKVRETIAASIDHGYGYVEELKRIHGGEGLDKTGNFLKAFSDAMVSQGLKEPSRSLQDYALGRVKSLHSVEKKREAEVALMSGRAALQVIPMVAGAAGVSFEAPVAEAATGGAAEVPPSEPSAPS